MTTTTPLSTCEQLHELELEAAELRPRSCSPLMTYISPRRKRNHKPPKSRLISIGTAASELGEVPHVGRERCAAEALLMREGVHELAHLLDTVEAGT